MNLCFSLNSKTKTKRNTKTKFSFTKKRNVDIPTWRNLCSGLTQIVHYSSSFYTIFHSVIYNYVVKRKEREVGREGVRE